MQYEAGHYDVIVVGAGHAGVKQHCRSKNGRKNINVNN